MKKLLGILAALGMAATTGVSVVACGTKTENESENTVELSTVISTLELGTIADNQESTVLSALKAKNADLNTDEITISNISETGASITAKDGSTVYTGNVEVTFNIATENVDKTALEALIGDAEKIKAEDNQYGDFDKLTLAISTAKAVAENTDSTQQQVDDAVIALQTAIDEFNNAVNELSNYIKVTDLGVLAASYNLGLDSSNEVVLKKLMELNDISEMAQKLSLAPKGGAVGFDQVQQVVVSINGDDQIIDSTVIVTFTVLSQHVPTEVDANGVITKLGYLFEGGPSYSLVVRVDIPDEAISMADNVQLPEEVNSLNEAFKDKDLTNFVNTLSKWDTSSITTMVSTFSGSQLEGNLDLSKWNTSNVTNMEATFWNSNISNINITGWDTSKSTSFRLTFAESTPSQENKITGIETLNVSSATTFFAMFEKRRMSEVVNEGSFKDWKLEGEAITMHNMFSNSDWTDVNMSAVGFADWDVINVADFSGFLNNAISTGDTMDFSQWTLNESANISGFAGNTEISEGHMPKK